LSTQVSVKPSATYTKTPLPPTKTPTNTPVPPTATSTNTPLPTSTPTPVRVTLRIVTVQTSADQNRFIVALQAENKELIKSYHLQIIGKSDGLLVGEYVFATPPYDSLTLPYRDLSGGDYVIRVSALDERDLSLTQAQVTVSYVPPSPTPTGTYTPTP